MNIGRFASWYRWIEYTAFGRTLEGQRFAFLNRLAGARRVLSLGEGDGRMLARLLAEATEARVDVVEISPEMITLARDRIGSSARVEFFCGDAREVNWEAAQFDAIVTDFFLDCFGEADARRLILRLAEALKPNGLWLISEFSIPQKGWRRLHARLWVGTMYLFFRLTTGLRATKLPPVEKLMLEAGMERAERQTKRAGLMVSEVWRHKDARLSA